MSERKPSTTIINKKNQISRGLSFNMGCFLKITSKRSKKDIKDFDFKETERSGD